MTIPYEPVELGEGYIFERLVKEAYRGNRTIAKSRLVVGDWRPAAGHWFASYIA